MSYDAPAASPFIHIIDGAVQAHGTEAECAASRRRWSRGIVRPNPAHGESAAEPAAEPESLSPLMALMAMRAATPAPVVEVAPVVEPAAAEPAAEPAPAPTPVVEVVTPAWEARADMDLDQRMAENAKRIEAHADHLARYGIAHAPPIYAAGRPVNSIGQANVLSRRQELDAMPLLVDGLRKVARQVEAEGRRDVIVSSDDLRMQDDGSLIRTSHPGRPGLAVEERGLAAVLSSLSEVMPRSFSMMRILDPALRARIFNDQISKLTDHRMCLRVRRTHEGAPYSLFAVVSERYAAFDGDRTAHLMADSLIRSGQGDLRGEVILDPETTRLSAHGFYRVDGRTDVSAGDMIQAGIRLTSKDDGTGGIKVDGTSLRNLCLNLIIISSKSAQLANVRHIGSEDKMIARVAAGIAAGKDFLAPFAEAWGALGQESVWDHLTSGALDIRAKDVEKIEEEGLTGRQRLERLFDAVGRTMPAPKDVGSSILLTGWAAEPVDPEAFTLRDLVNASTRVHEQEKVPVLVRSAVEEHAGEMVRRMSLAL